jgi:transcriptional regulator with XRE-family HTH domain
MWDRDLGQRLRTLRNERRLTQKQLGRLLGVSPQQVHHHEHGIGLTRARLERLASAFKVSVKEMTSPDLGRSSNTNADLRRS